MAAHGDSHGDEYKHGSMDMSGHWKAWAGFTSFVKWSIVGILAIMIFLVIFRTHG